MMSWDFPFPDQLDRHPQLGPLAIIEAALEVAESAVAAGHPELWLEAEDGSSAYQAPVQVRQLLVHASRLRRALRRYRASLQMSSAIPRDTGDIPF